MPLYEYVCEEDGTRVEALRPMAQADEPLPDPEGRGRVFKRALSTFSTGAAGAGQSAPVGGCCPCGKPGGGCGGR
ncbi:MAG: zinc ribbon domain-containing protein [Phycisphaerae bacterium]|nr:zinc ribbon domain-containing protein [Phycisphaerae bacterium]